MKQFDFLYVQKEIYVFKKATLISLLTLFMCNKKYVALILIVLYWKQIIKLSQNYFQINEKKINQIYNISKCLNIIFNFNYFQSFF